ncbi:MAG: hypothetical protein RBT80_25390 [Candidatus Vecturithrix sp.]|nr:hypothetical protein [Candidatus Vecturithrix sp.]
MKIFVPRTSLLTGVGLWRRSRRIPLGADRGRSWVLAPRLPSHQWPVSTLKQAEARYPIPQGASASFRFKTGE